MITRTRDGYDVACDGHGCKAKIGEPCDTKKQALENKHKYGWATISTPEGYKDLCPKCDFYRGDE